MAVAFDNLVIASGIFKQDTRIVTVTVPDGGLVRGSLLGKITATGKHILSLNAAGDGSESANSILESDLENDTGSPVDVQAVVYCAGTFNTLGVTYGTGQTIANTYDSLDAVNIRITDGRA
jgi:hypothetical protein